MGNRILQVGPRIIHGINVLDINQQNTESLLHFTSRIALNTLIFALSTTADLMTYTIVSLGGITEADFTPDYQKAFEDSVIDGIDNATMHYDYFPYVNITSFEALSTRGLRIGFNTSIGTHNITYRQVAYQMIETHIKENYLSLSMSSCLGSISLTLMTL